MGIQMEEKDVQTSGIEVVEQETPRFGSAPPNNSEL